jgi:hypothetical protein
MAWDETQYIHIGSVTFVIMRDDGSFVTDSEKEGLEFQITWNTVARGQLF